MQARKQCSDILSELETWFATDRGQYLMQVTRNALQDILDTAFGYHVLQLGLAGQEPLLNRSRINHKLYCSERPGEHVSVVAHPDELPIDSDSIDVVIVHHCLEFARNPHKVLSEIQRVLTPHGQVIVVGINPHSLLGVGGQLRRVWRDNLWSNHAPLTVSRLGDWLRLLNFEQHERMFVGAVVPTGTPRMRRGMAGLERWAARHKLPFGGVYVIRATKHVVGMQPPRRRRSARLIDLVPARTPRPAPIPQQVKALKDKASKY